MTWLKVEVEILMLIILNLQVQHLAEMRITLISAFISCKEVSASDHDIHFFMLCVWCQGSATRLGCFNTSHFVNHVCFLSVFFFVSQVAATSG